MDGYSKDGYSSKFRHPEPLPKIVTAFSKVVKYCPNISPVALGQDAFMFFFP